MKTILALLLLGATALLVQSEEFSAEHAEFMDILEDEEMEDARRHGGHPHRPRPSGYPQPSKRPRPSRRPRPTLPAFVVSSLVVLMLLFITLTFDVLSLAS